MDALTPLATAHLVLRLQPLNRALRAAVERQKLAAQRLARPDLSPLCLTEEHVRILLEEVEDCQSGRALAGEPAALSSDELQAEENLRRRSFELGKVLPLDRLSQTWELPSFELEALLLCAAPEVDRNYERIYAFILDDLNRRHPCMELFVSLTATSLEEQFQRRLALGSFGRLRRYGVLLPFGDAPSELRQEFRLAPGVFDFLTGAFSDASLPWRDHLEVIIPPGTEPPPQVSPKDLAHWADAFLTGSLAALGIWGPRQNGSAELVMALALAMRRPLRRIATLDLERAAGNLTQMLDEQLRVASVLGAAVWFDTDTDSAPDPARERLQYALAESLANSGAPLLVTGEFPWRPAPLLRSGKYTELELLEPAHQAQEKLWSDNFPELEPEEIGSLASRYRLSGANIRSISQLARTRARFAGNGQPDPVKDHVAAACSVVTQRSGSHFAVVVHPQHRREDLILPENLHRQVMEIGAFFRLQPRVDEEWGFGRLVNGCGLKALFTGDPGTGKTLAAEVIAGLLELPLYKVDLARIVSKWVGETEKNLESVFREAEESHAVLFFDEAEALFGKRAEVQHGTDRYANLEVSYLLQRIESSGGLVILASNVKDQIDTAFVRRFQVVVHFPRPGIPERRRIWQLAFPSSAPVDAEVDLDALARLDMTGAAIVSAARTAALLAADSSAPAISMAHVIRATARQFRREARVLTPGDLGAYGILLQGAS